MQIEYKGVTFTSQDEIPEEDAWAYVEHYLERFNGNIEAIDVKLDGDFADVHYTLKEARPFERIRRITGYLVGTLDRFIDAKRAEESERVKHKVNA